MQRRHRILAVPPFDALRGDLSADRTVSVYVPFCVSTLCLRDFVPELQLCGRDPDGHTLKPNLSS